MNYSRYLAGEPMRRRTDARPPLPRGFTRAVLMAAAALVAELVIGIAALGAAGGAFVLVGLVVLVAALRWL